MLHRRRFLTSALAAPRGLAAPARRRPNIVLVMADDFGFECVGVNGSTSYKTPNLDRLAAQGVRFTNAHSTPLCTPTRVQLMTGKYNFRNYTEFGSLRPGEFTFAHLLRQAGYRTGVAGKWQLAGAIEGAAYKGKGTLPAEAGFDEYCLWQVQARGSRYWDPTVDRNGQLEPALSGRYGPDLFCRFAEEFIQRHRDRPFFFYYPMNLTHDPFVPTPHSAAAESLRQKNDSAWFADMAAYLDHLIGRLLSTLREQNLDRDTLFLFTGDNGTLPAITTQTRSGPVRGGKGSSLLTGTHVPLLARWSGVTPAGGVCSDLVDFTDFFPTLAEAAGAPMPAGHPRDGRSVLPQMKGEKGQPRDWIFCDYNPRWGRFTPARWAMSHRYKLYSDDRAFDLEQDPAEFRPLPPGGLEFAPLRQALARFA